MITPEILTGRLGNKLFQIAYLYSQMRDGVIPDWFVQDPKYFEKYDNEIKRLFGDNIIPSDYTAIHLRVNNNPINPNEPRYSENPFYVNLTKTNYYSEALKLFPSEKFLVFSDDVEFAKDYFKGLGFEFDESNELDAFNRMAGCKNQIIANSSYSWWCAFLNPHPNKIVVAPSNKLWYSDGIERTKCPLSWTRL